MLEFPEDMIINKSGTNEAILLPAINRSGALPHYRSRHATTSPNQSPTTQQLTSSSPSTFSYLSLKTCLLFVPPPFTTCTNTCTHTASTQTNRGSVKRQVQSSQAQKRPRAKHTDSVLNATLELKESGVQKRERKKK